MFFKCFNRDIMYCDILFLVSEVDLFIMDLDFKLGLKIRNATKVTECAL